MLCIEFIVYPQVYAENGCFTFPYVLVIIIFDQTNHNKRGNYYDKPYGAFKVQRKIR